MSAVCINHIDFKSIYDTALLCKPPECFGKLIMEKKENVVVNKIKNQWLAKLMNGILRRHSSLNGFLRNFSRDRIFKDLITFSKATGYVCS